MKKVFLLLAFLLNISWVNAQIILPAELSEDVKITFRVIDSLEKVGIPYLSGWLMADTVENVFLTDSKGIVELKVPIFTRTITIKIKSKFYRPYEKQFFFNMNQPDLGKIMLSPSEEMLAEVNVVGQRTIDQDIDKLTYKFKNASPTTTLEMAITEVPLLSRAGDALKVRGTKNATIYLNGKRVESDILKNLQVKEVLKVEVIENPPLSELMDVDQAIVNIVTKKTDEHQLHGNFSAGYGFLRPFISTGGMLTLKTPKLYLNYFGNWYTQRQKGNWELERRKESSSQTFLRQKGDADAKYTINTHNFQLFYDFTSNTTLSVDFKFFEPNNQFNETLNVNFNEPTITSRNYSRSSTPIIGGDIELTQKISDFSTVVNTFRLTKDKDVRLNGSDNASSLRNWVESDNHLQGNLYAYQLKHQWQPAFNRKLSLDYGILAILNDYNTKFAFYQWNHQASRLEKISDLSQNTHFQQKRGMFFATTTFPWLKSRWQLGARVERVQNHFTDSESQRTIDQQNFYNFIPRFKWMKKTAKYGSFALALSSFVKLPNFSLLNPYIQVDNPNFSTAGNIQLKKETHYRTELTHDVDFRQGFLSVHSSIYHQWSDNEIIRRTLLTASNDSVLVRFYDNIRRFSKTGTSVALRGFLGNWFVNVTLYGERYAFDSPFVPTQNRHGLVWGTTLNVTKSLQKYEFRLNANYENFSFDANARIYRLPSIGLGIDRKWWKDQLTTSLSLVDIFNTNAKKRQVYYDGVYYQTYRSFYSIRFINFSVTYTFGKPIMFFKSSQGMPQATEMKK